MKRLFKIMCFLGLHWTGRSDQSCMHNISVCAKCKKDVLWLINDEAKNG